MQRLFQKFLFFKFNTQELNFDRVHLAVFINILNIIILAIFALLNTFSSRKNFTLATIEATFLVASLLILYHFYKTRNVHILTFSTTVIIFGISVSYFPLVPKELFASSWLFFFPFIVFMLNDLKKGRKFIFLYLLIVLSYIYLGIGEFTATPGFINISFSLVIFTFFIYQFELSRRKAYDKLAIVIQQLEQLSMIDELTRLYNRHFLNKHILQNEKLISQPFLFCITDIDNFKLYNDTYGHQKGDEVLKKIAIIKKQCLENKSDSFVFRLGGEEFGAFIFNEQDNIKKLENFLYQVEKLSIKHKKNPPYNVCTVSIGAVVFHKKVKLDFNTIYQLADEALYEAKKNGKNCMVVKEYL